MQTSLDGPTILHIPRYNSLEDLDKNITGVETIISKDLTPVLLRNGYIFTHSPADGIRGEYLTTHAYIGTDQDGLISTFLQYLAVHRFGECFKIILKLDEKLGLQMYEALGKYALKHVELGHAENAFRQCKNVGMVYSIGSIKDETEKYILMGHIASILSFYEKAQGFFLKSSRPELALEMRCDLQDWYTALKLVQNIDPERENYICRKLAVQIENQGNSVEALKLFERALLNDDPDAKEHNTI
jgi:WD repeat-containing protein 19